MVVANLVDDPVLLLSSSSALTTSFVNGVLDLFKILQWADPLRGALIKRLGIVESIDI